MRIAPELCRRGEPVTESFYFEGRRLLGATIRLGGTVGLAVMRPAGRRLSDAALTALDAALVSPVAEEAVDRVMASGLARHTVERIVDRLLVDGIVEHTVDRVLDGSGTRAGGRYRPREPVHRAPCRTDDREPLGGPGRCPPARPRRALAARGGNRREPRRPPR